MLEVLEMKSSYKSYFEKDKASVIFVSEKMNPLELQAFAETYHTEKCYFKDKKNNKIEIVKANSKEINFSRKLFEMRHECDEEPCPGLLQLLGQIFKTDLVFKRDCGLAHIISMNKIYPVLLACLRQTITDTPLYFTTSIITGDNYEKPN